MSAEEALRLAAALERASPHAAARALVGDAARRGLSLPLPFRLRVHSGLGIEGEIEGEPGPILLGSRRLLARKGISIEEDLEKKARDFEAEGHTVVFLGSGKKARAAFALGESIRKDAFFAIDALRRAGVSLEALTGDGEAAAAALGRALGIAVRANLLPDEKVREIERRERAGIRCLMVGDGLNDAPALAAASVGIAVEGGLDFAKKAAPIALLRADLCAIPRLLDLARKTARTIRWNLAWGFLYNGAAMTLAAAGRLHPAIAALAMLFSSLFLVRQSFLLRDVPLLAAGAKTAGAPHGIEAALLQ
jgi:Cu+-exporting ATPase